MAVDATASVHPFIRVRAVVFDAMGTVIVPSPSVAAVYQAALTKHCGLELPLDQIQTTLKSALRARSVSDSLETSEDAENLFWNRFIRDLAGDASGRDACFDELFLHFARSSSWICFEDVAETVARLAESGLVLAIASNFDRRLHAVLDEMDALNRIPHRFVSSEIGWRKPSPQFFDAVCRGLGIPSNEVLVVGDDLTNDVVGAQRSGCRAAWIRRGTADQDAPDGTICLSRLTDLPGRIAASTAPDVASRIQRES